MSYRGMMDGYHGDENECNGHCNNCQNCEQLYYQSSDEAYDLARDDDFFN